MSSFIPIYAVDFDGTLCESKWPGIGAPNKKLIQHLVQRRTELRLAAEKIKSYQDENGLKILWSSAESTTYRYL